MNNEPNKPTELTEKELEGIVGGSGTGVLVDPGPNACVIVQGAEDLGGPFEDMGELKTKDGTAEFGLQGKYFFKR